MLTCSRSSANLRQARKLPESSDKTPAGMGPIVEHSTIGPNYAREKSTYLSRPFLLGHNVLLV